MLGLGPRSVGFKVQGSLMTLTFHRPGHGVNSDSRVGLLPKLLKVKVKERGYKGRI